jgi:hypothetical protein
MGSNVIHIERRVTCANAGEAKSIVVEIAEALWQYRRSVCSGSGGGLRLRRRSFFVTSSLSPTHARH